MTDETHRTTPIEDTIEHVLPYPENFFIYKIPGSKYYQATARLNGIRAKKSLKTKSRAIAKQAAKEFFDELCSKKAQNIPLVESPNFAKAYQDLLKADQRKIDCGKRKKSTVKDAEYLWEADIGKFFGRMHCKDVSGYAGPTLTQQTLAASVSELLAKPLQSRQIAATLARVLHRTA